MFNYIVNHEEAHVKEIDWNIIHKSAHYTVFNASIGKYNMHTSEKMIEI